MSAKTFRRQKVTKTSTDEDFLPTKIFDDKVFTDKVFTKWFCVSKLKFIINLLLNEVFYFEGYFDGRVPGLQKPQQTFKINSNFPIHCLSTFS